MKARILVDTGPIVAVLDRKDAHHVWAIDQFKTFSPLFLTCEAVITEASHILKRNGFHADIVFELITLGGIALGFDLKQERSSVETLMKRYRDNPMDLADACLVRMTELYQDSTVLTLDSDFHVYRKHRRETIPVIMP